MSLMVQKDPALSRAPKIGHSRKNKKHLNKPEFEYKRNIDRRGWGPFAIRNVFEGLLYGTAVCNAGCNPCAFLAGHPQPPQKGKLMNKIWSDFCWGGYLLERGGGWSCAFRPMLERGVLTD